MKLARVVGGLQGLAAICLLPAFAQSGATGELRIVSSFVRPGKAVPGVCLAEAKTFLSALAGRAHPQSWHWVLVCDEVGWRRFLVLSGRPGEDNIWASTDIPTRTTYLRGPKLLHPNEFGRDADTVVTHELAHIELGGGDEWAAENLARNGLGQFGVERGRVAQFKTERRHTNLGQR